MAKRRTRFGTWCRRDLDDERKINYTFRNFNDDGEDAHFTSEDTCNYSTLERLREAWIESIELINNEWNVILYED